MTQTNAMLGKILTCNGGIYTVETENGTQNCYAKGSFRHDNIIPVTGDIVEIFPQDDKESQKSGFGYITKVLPRKSFLPRPPIANLDVLFIISAVSNPAPALLNIDKLSSIAVYNNVRPIIIFNKKELDSEKAQELYNIYEKSNQTTLVISARTDNDLQKLLFPYMKNKTSAFAGPSGTGKSTLLNVLFPNLSLKTGEVSYKTQRGKHTTRQSELYNLSMIFPDYFKNTNSYLADTPGFTALDFEKNFFMDKKDLASTFLEFSEYQNECRYSKCTHLCEEGCAIITACNEGKISKQRHESYIYLYKLANKFICFFK